MFLPILPKKLKNHASIEKEVLFVGLGPTFQIWNPQNYNNKRNEFNQVSLMAINVIGVPENPVIGNGDPLQAEHSTKMDDVGYAMYMDRDICDVSNRTNNKCLRIIGSLLGRTVRENGALTTHLFYFAASHNVLCSLSILVTVCQRTLLIYNIVR